MSGAVFAGCAGRWKSSGVSGTMDGGPSRLSSSTWKAVAGMSENVQPSRDLLDVTHLPLDAVRHATASADHPARRLAEELVNQTSAAQDQRAEQYGS
jgi:hypothetical protein